MPKLADTDNRYGPVSVLNHWLGAVMVILLLTIGLYFHEMPKGDQLNYWKGLHISLGALFFLFLAFRVGWRLLGKAPAPVKQARYLQIAAKAVHHLLLACVAIMIISGPLMIWSKGYPVRMFDLLSIPSPIGKMEALHEILEVTHKVTSRVLLVLITLHVLAALKHAFMDGDETLRRMLERQSRGQ